MHEVVRALVLRETEYKESTKLLTVLTESGEKRTVSARGAMKKNSKLSASAQLLVFSEMTLFSYRERDTLEAASTLEEFRALRADVERLSLGCYFAELTELLANEDAATAALLPLILNALYALGEDLAPKKQVKAAFELRLMCLAGYEPLLDACALCGREQPQEPRLDLRDGVLHCAACPTGEGISMPLCAGSLAALRHVAHCEAKRLYAFRLEKDALRRVGDVCEAFVLTQMERGFHTLDFYKKLTLEEIEKL